MTEPTVDDLVYGDASPLRDLPLVKWVDLATVIESGVFRATYKNEDLAHPDFGVHDLVQPSMIEAIRDAITNAMGRLGPGGVAAVEWGDLRNPIDGETVITFHWFVGTR